MTKNRIISTKNISIHYYLDRFEWTSMYLAELYPFIFSKFLNSLVPIQLQVLSVRNRQITTF